MKTILSALVLLTITMTNADAQVQNPVHWAFGAKKIKPGIYEVHLTATINEGWHTYSQTTPDGGPVPTAFHFIKNPLQTIDGNVKEAGRLEQHHEPLFGVDVKQFSGKVDFIQTIVVKGTAKTSLSGSVEFMCCNDHECLPPSTQQFTISLQ